MQRSNLSLSEGAGVNESGQKAQTSHYKINKH